MRRTEYLQAFKSLSLCLLSVFGLSACFPGGFSNGLQLTQVESELAEMHRSLETSTWIKPPKVEINAAQELARQRWPEFVEAYKAWTPELEAKTFGADKQPKESTFEVKIPLGMLVATEDLWMYVTGLDDKKVVGRLEAEPKFLKMYQRGSTVSFPIARVEDWVYGHDTAPVGGFTTTVLRAYKLREMLGIEMRDGRPNPPSVQACEKNLKRIDNNWLSHKHGDSDDKKSQEMRDWDWWQKTSPILTALEKSITANEKRVCTDERLAEVSGVPPATIAFMKKMDVDYLAWMNDAGHVQK